MSTVCEILIAGLTPYFLEKRWFRFEKNFEKISHLVKSQAWWQNNCIFLKPDQTISLSSLAAKLSDFNYEKVQTPSFPAGF